MNRYKYPKKINPATVFFALLFVVLTAFASASISEAIDEIRITIEKGPTGAPAGWKVKEWRGKADFEVLDTEAGKTVHMKSESTSSALYRDAKFDIKDYPYLRWKWKVTKLPAGGDVRKKSADDQAAQLYVVFPRWPAPVNSKIIGYIWDSTVPAGLTVQSTKTSSTKYIVLRGRSENLGKWLTEKRNVYEDYKRLFKEEPPQVGSISLMIDSDDTKSSAESYIGDIYFSKEK